jgi:hypothetical protein
MRPRPYHEQLTRQPWAFPIKPRYWVLQQRHRTADSLSRKVRSIRWSRTASQAKATGEAAQKYYRTARTYNSGSLDASGSLGRGGATACYCSDIANRLLGWSQGASLCSVAEVSA